MNESNEQNLRSPLRIHLEGPAVRRHRIALHDLVLFCGQLQAAVDRVARVLLGETESMRPGRKRTEIKSGCALDIVRIDPGSLSVLCDLPFQDQHSFPFMTDDLGEEALAAFVDGISLLENSQAPLPKGYDKGVLIALRESGKLLDHGIERISFSLQTRGRACNSTYTPEVHAALVARIQEPVQNRRTIEGRLLMGDFKETALRCRVHPPIGKPISCSFDEPLKEAVLSLLTHYVRLVGDASESDGEIVSLTIEDIEALDNAPEEESASMTPTFFDARTELDALAAAQGVTATPSFEKLLGNFWPEDETADDFIASTQRWRHEGEATEEP